MEPASFVASSNSTNLLKEIKNYQYFRNKRGKQYTGARNTGSNMFKY